MEMSTETLQWLKDQALAAADKAIIELDGEKFIISNGTVKRFTFNDAPETIEGHTLDGMLDAINKELLESPVKSVHIVNPTELVVYGVVDQFGNRPQLMRVNAYRNDFKFGSWYDQESFQIALRALFEDTPHREALIKFAGDLVDDDSTTYSDNGVTQTATVKTGISTVGVAEVPSPARLAPRRTFIEVQQPASEFIYRVRKGGESALFEADGGAWRNEAINNVKLYIIDKLPEYVDVIA